MFWNARSLRAQLTKTAFIVATFTLSACGNLNNEDETTDSFPTVPPIEAFQSNTTKFDESSTASLQLNRANHTIAALNALAYWAVELVLIAPRLAFQGAASQSEITVLEDGWLQKSFDITHEGVVHTGKLQAKIEDLSTSKTSWKFLVTRTPADANGCCTDRLWFEGTTEKTSGTSATETKGDFYMHDLTHQDTTDKWRRYEYTHDAENTAAYSMTWTNLTAVNDYKVNSTIARSQADTDYVITIDKDPETDGKHIIQWNPSTKAGSHTKEDGTKVCWNTSLENTDCTAQ